MAWHIRSLGYSAVPSLTRQQMQEMGAICFPIARPIIGRQMGIIFRRRAPMSRAAEAFITLLEQQKWDDVF
jgi:LysR family carnitine catabolism transcriptional activator